MKTFVHFKCNIEIDLDTSEKRVTGSGEVSPAFGHANASFPVFTDRIRIISEEMNNDNNLNLHSMASRLVTGKQP